jgi:hypothetical protein
MRQTHTYVILRLSPSTFREIEEKLIQAGYGHVFGKDPDRDDGKPVMDMQGIAIGLETE